MMRKMKRLQALSLWLVLAFGAQDVLAFAPSQTVLTLSGAKPEIRFSFPESVAFIDDWYRVPDPQGTPVKSAARPQVILFQDAHTNFSGQVNLAKALEEVLVKEGIARVYVEGGRGDVTLSSLKAKADPKLLAEVSHRFLRDGILHGEEYLNLTSNIDFRILGAENEELYRQCIRAYADAVKTRREALLYLDRVNRGLKDQEHFVFNPELAGFETVRERHRSGSLSITAYFGELLKQAGSKGIYLGSYRNLRVLKRLDSLEKRIDFRKASREEAEALAGLSPPDREELKELASRIPARLSQVSDPSQNHFFLLQEKLPRGHGYGELAKYFRYLKESRKLSGLKVLEELESLENEVLSRLAVTPDEKLLISLKDTTRLLNNLVSLKIAPSELDRLNKSRGLSDARMLTGFVNGGIAARQAGYEGAVALEEALERAQKAARAFYSVAQERDKVFLEVIKESLSSQTDPGEPIVLITGGFHTPALKEALRRRNISFVSVLPQVREETDLARYERILFSQLENDPRGRPASAAASAVEAHAARPEPMVNASANATRFTAALKLLPADLGSGAQARMAVPTAPASAAPGDRWQALLEEWRQARGAAVRSFSAFDRIDEHPSLAVFDGGGFSIPIEFSAEELPADDQGTPALKNPYRMTGAFLEEIKFRAWLDHRRAASGLRATDEEIAGLIQRTFPENYTRDPRGRPVSLLDFDLDAFRSKRRLAGISAQPRIYQFNVAVTLNELRKTKPGATLADALSDEQLARLRADGFTHLWPMGEKERDPAAVGIALKAGKHGPSPYALKSDRTAAEWGGPAAHDALESRLERNGQGLVGDYVSNHFGFVSDFMRKYHDKLFIIREKTDERVLRQREGRREVNEDYWFDYDKWAAEWLAQHPDRTDALIPALKGKVILRAQEGGTGGTRSLGTGDVAQISLHHPESWEILATLVGEAAAQVCGEDRQGAGILRFDLSHYLWRGHLRDRLAGFLAPEDLRQFDENYKGLEPWKYVFSRVRKEYPNLTTVAEVYGGLRSNIALSTLGFDYVYDKDQGFYDLLVSRQNTHALNVHLRRLDILGRSGIRSLIFNENHDEKSVAAAFPFNRPAHAATIFVRDVTGMAMLAYHGEREGKHTAKHDAEDTHDSPEDLAKQDPWRTQMYDHPLLDHPAIRTGRRKPLAVLNGNGQEGAISVYQIEHEGRYFIAAANIGGVTATGQIRLPVEELFGKSMEHGLFVLRDIGNGYNLGPRKGKYDEPADNDPVYLRTPAELKELRFVLEPDQVQVFEIDPVAHGEALDKYAALIALRRQIRLKSVPFWNYEQTLEAAQPGSAAAERNRKALWWSDPLQTRGLLSLPIWALRRPEGDTGIGEFTDPVRRWKDFGPEGQGFGGVLLLPPYATLVESPFEPVSNWALNELMIDWSVVDEVTGDPALTASLIAPAGERREVNYEAVSGRKGPVRREAYRRFKNRPERVAAFEAFWNERPKRAKGLEEYAEFMAIHAILNKPSMEWTAADEAAARKDARFEELVGMHRYAQWIAHLQFYGDFVGGMHRLGAVIAVDQPRFVARDSATVYFNRASFRDGYPGVVNAYVDERWEELALYRWTEIEKNGFALVLDPVQDQLKSGIDAFRGDAVNFLFGSSAFHMRQFGGERTVRRLYNAMARDGVFTAVLDDTATDQQRIDAMNAVSKDKGLYKRLASWPKQRGLPADLADTLSSFDTGSPELVTVRKANRRLFEAIYPQECPGTFLPIDGYLGVDDDDPPPAERLVKAYVDLTAGAFIAEAMDGTEHAVQAQGALVIRHPWDAGRNDDGVMRVSDHDSIRAGDARPGQHPRPAHASAADALREVQTRLDHRNFHLFNATLVIIALGDLTGDTVPVKSYKQVKRAKRAKGAGAVKDKTIALWRYREPMPEDPDYAARARFSASLRNLRPAGGPRMAAMPAEEAVRSWAGLRPVIEKVLEDPDLDVEPPPVGGNRYGSAVTQAQRELSSQGLLSEFRQGDAAAVEHLLNMVFDDSRALYQGYTPQHVLGLLRTSGRLEAVSGEVRVGIPRWIDRISEGLRSTDIHARYRSASVLHLIKSMGFLDPVQIALPRIQGLYDSFDALQDMGLSLEDKALVAAAYHGISGPWAGLPPGHWKKRLLRPLLSALANEKKSLTRQDADDLARDLEARESVDDPDALIQTVMRFHAPLRLQAAQFGDGGNAINNFPELWKALFPILPASGLERPQGLPRRGPVRMDEVGIVRSWEELIQLAGMPSGPREPDLQLGRTAFYDHGVTSTAVKLLKAGEDPASLTYEHDMMNFLRSRQKNWGLKGAYPQGRVRIVRIPASALPGISPEIRGQKGNLQLDQADGFFTAMIYQVEKGAGDRRSAYATYLNDPDLSHEEFEEAFQTNIDDLFTLLAHGIVSVELLELYHNESAGRGYDVVRDLWRSQWDRSGAGRVDNVPGGLLYPNSRKSGPADFEKVYFVGDLPEIPANRLNDDRVQNLLRLTRGDKQKLAHFLTASYAADAFFASVLLLATYLQRRGELSYETESAEADTFFQRNLKRLFERSYRVYAGQEPGSLSYDMQLIARQMAYYMTGKYAAEIHPGLAWSPPADLYPGAWVEPLVMPHPDRGPRGSRGWTERGNDLADIIYRVPSRAGDGGVETRSYDLGFVNGFFPPQMLLQSMFEHIARLMAAAAINPPRMAGASWVRIPLSSVEATEDPTRILPFLIDWIKEKRWFMDKDGRIENVSIEDSFAIGPDSPNRKMVGAVAALRLTGKDGVSTVKRYFVPVILFSSGVQPEGVATADTVPLEFKDGEQLSFALAERGPLYEAAVLSHYQRSAQLRTREGGTVTFVPIGEDLKTFDPASHHHDPKVIDSSNVATFPSRAGHRVAVQTFKNIRGRTGEPGRIWTPNDGVDRTQALAQEGFTNTPRLLGKIVYSGPGGLDLSMGQVTEYAENVGVLEKVFEGGLLSASASDEPAVRESTFLFAREVAAVIAQMHRAFSRAKNAGRVRFEPEIAGPEDLRSWAGHISDNLERGAAGLEARRGERGGEQVLGDLADRLNAAIPDAQRLIARLEGALSEGMIKGQVHGDLFAWQAVVRARLDGQPIELQGLIRKIEEAAGSSAVRDIVRQTLVLMDFEGPPVESDAAEDFDSRENPLVDLAGMIEGFWYLVNITLYGKLGLDLTGPDHAESRRRVSLVLAGQLPLEEAQKDPLLKKMTREQVEFHQKWLNDISVNFVDGYLDEMEALDARGLVLKEWDRQKAKELIDYFVLARAIHEVVFETSGTDRGWEGIPVGRVLALTRQAQEREAGGKETQARLVPPVQDAAPKALPFDGRAIQRAAPTRSREELLKLFAVRVASSLGLAQGGTRRYAVLFPGEERPSEIVVTRTGTDAVSYRIDDQTTVDIPSAREFLGTFSQARPLLDLDAAIRITDQIQAVLPALSRSGALNAAAGGKGLTYSIELPPVDELFAETFTSVKDRIEFLRFFALNAGLVAEAYGAGRVTFHLPGGEELLKGAPADLSDILQPGEALPSEGSHFRIRLIGQGAAGHREGDVDIKVGQFDGTSVPSWAVVLAAGILTVDTTLPEDLGGKTPVDYFAEDAVRFVGSGAETIVRILTILYGPGAFSTDPVPFLENVRGIRPFRADLRPVSIVIAVARMAQMIRQVRVMA